MTFKVRIHTGGEDIVASVSEAEAVDGVLAGKMAFESDQLSPPFKLIEFLASNVDQIQRFGPAGSDPKVLRKIDEEAFKYGRRNAVIEGRQLNWVPSGWKFITQAERLLTHQMEGQRGMSHQAQSIMDRHLDWQAKAHARDILSDEQCDRERLIRSILPVVGEFIEYRRVNEEWYEFHKHLKRFESDLRDVIRQGLLEVRIICSEEALGSERLRAPTVAAASNRFWGRADKGLNYFFSKDLPDEWFDDGEVLAFQQNIGCKTQ
jgi:hypothetical protein